MRGDGDGPSPVSPAEKRLERIHNEDIQGLQEKVEELRQKLLDKDLRLAELVAGHRDCPYDSRMDVLEACDHDGETLGLVADSLSTTIPEHYRTYE